MFPARLAILVLLPVIAGQPAVGQPDETAATPAPVWSVTDRELLTSPRFTSIEGAPALVAQIQRVDLIISHKGRTTSEQADAAREFRTLAVAELRSGVGVAINSAGPPRLPIRQADAATRYARAAETVLASPIHNLVTTRISAARPNWVLSFVSLRDHQRGTSPPAPWLSYSYGRALPIRAYVFRLQGFQGGVARACTRTVAVWEDPTEQELDCDRLP
jgi:hypothetical protein